MPTATGIQTLEIGPPVLSGAEIRRLLALFDRRKTGGRRNACLLALLLGSGGRVGEVVRLTRDQVELAPGGKVRLTIRQNKRPVGAPAKYRLVTLPEPAARLVREWLDRSDSPLWLLPGRRGEHLSVRAAQHVVKAALSKIGRSDCHTHSCRHSAAVAVTRQTGDLWLTSRILGHASVTTTQASYSRWDPSDADRAASALAGAWQPRKYRGTR